MNVITVDSAGCRINQRQVLREISFAVEPGEFLGIAGLNGSGKTTLLKMLLRIYPRITGAIQLKSHPIEQYSQKEFARIIAALPQNLRISFNFTARELVLLGRTPHLGFLSSLSKRDARIGEQSMSECDCLEFADRSIFQLSAGEVQRVYLAAALAQQPEILLLDEPTTALDIRQQSRLVRLLYKLKSRGLSILCASHDLQLLRCLSDHVLLLDRGQPFRYGSPEHVFDHNILHNHFELPQEGLCPLRFRK